MIDIPIEDLPIWNTYDRRCIGCGTKNAVCLHEYPHKSKNPKWRDFPKQRYPLCAKCHDYCHSGKMTSGEEGAFLDYNRDKWFPDWEQVLERLLLSVGINPGEGRAE